ncbi:MFS transporter [Ochrobactrum teleogrylli]|uniref:MFS transporter n=1 Tax=Ochrobactrum teleogrylli TaxID=2479765 RepID=UPI003850AFB0
MWSSTSPPASGASNQRGGAIRWDVWEDVADPGRIVGGFVVDSWIERQRGRAPVAKVDVLDRGLLNALYLGDQPPTVAASMTSLSEGT